MVKSNVPDFSRTFRQEYKNFHAICTFNFCSLSTKSFLAIWLSHAVQVSYKRVSNNEGVSQIIFSNCDESNLSILLDVKYQNLDHKASEIYLT